MKELEMVGTVMELTFVTSQTHLRRKVEVFTTLLPSRFNSCMTMMRSMLPIATLTLILIVQNFWSDSVSQRKKTGLERPLFAKPLLETIVKWQ